MRRFLLLLALMLGACDDPEPPAVTPPASPEPAPPAPSGPRAEKKPAGSLAPTEPGIALATGFGGFADLHSHAAVHRGFNGISHPDTTGEGAPDWSPFWSANVKGAVDDCWDLSSCSNPGPSDESLGYLRGNTGPIKTSYALLQTGDGSVGTRRHQLGHWANDEDIGRAAHRNFVTGALSNLAGHGHLDQLTVPTEPDGSASTLQRADGWPNARDLVHEQMTPTMMYRAFRGGQRLMVAAATDSQALVDVWNSGIASAGTESKAVPRLDRAFSADDLGSLRAQLKYIRLVARKNWRWMCVVTTPQQAARVINGDDFTNAELPDCAPLKEDPDDPLSPPTTVVGGKVAHLTGNPFPAPTALANGAAITGRMAVVLAAEMDSLTPRQILDLYGDGVRVATPIHLVDSYFGGSALYIDLFNAATDYYCYRDTSPYRDQRCSDNWNPFSQTWLMPAFEAGGAYDPLLTYRPGQPALKLRFSTHVFDSLFPIPLTESEFEANYNSDKEGGVRNAKGLAPTGADELRRLMARGLMIDVAHMSQEATEDTLNLAESLTTAYPLIDTHTGLRDDTAPGTPGKSGEGHHERDLLASHATRLAQLGGMIGLGTSDTIDVLDFDDPPDTSGTAPKKGNIYNAQSGTFTIPSGEDGSGNPEVHAINFAGGASQVIDKVRVTLQLTGSFGDIPVGAYATISNRLGEIVGTASLAVTAGISTVEIPLDPPQLRSTLAQIIIEPADIGVAANTSAFAVLASQADGQKPTGGIELHVQGADYLPGESIADRPFHYQDPALVHLFDDTTGLEVAPDLDAEVTSIDVMVWTTNDNLNGPDWANLNDSAAFAYLGVDEQTAFADNAIESPVMKDLKDDEFAGWSQNVCIEGGQWWKPCPSPYTDWQDAVAGCVSGGLVCYPVPFDPAAHPGHPVINPDFQIVPSFWGTPYAAKRFTVTPGVKVKDVSSFAIQAFIHGHETPIFDVWNVGRVAAWLNDDAGHGFPLTLWTGEGSLNTETGGAFVMEHTDVDAGGNVYTESGWLSTLQTWEAKPAGAAPAFPSDPARHVELTVQPHGDPWTGDVIATLYTWKVGGVHSINLNHGAAWEAGKVYKVIIGLPAGTIAGDLVGMSLRSTGTDNQIAWLSLDTHPDPAPVWIGRYLKALAAMQTSAPQVWATGHGVALGTDINGLQDQVPFMELATGVFASDTTNVIKGKKNGALVDYKFDLTRDGIAHYGMLGDFAAGLAAYGTGGTTARNALNNSAQDFLTTWSRTSSAALALRLEAPVREASSAIATAGAVSVAVSIDETCLMKPSCTATVPPYSDPVWAPLHAQFGALNPSLFFAAGGTIAITGSCLGASSIAQPAIPVAAFGSSVTVTCQPEGCANPSATAQGFGHQMVGCAGAVTWPSRASMCAPGFVPCGATWWPALRGGTAPTHNYWTNDPLRYSGSVFSCAAQVSGGNACGPSTPMRVCTSGTDAEGNQCTWHNCGLGTTAPNQYFGGCSGSGGFTTAGTLCCRAPCADGSVEQTFTSGMFGCAGAVTHSAADSLCGVNYHVCSAQDWVARRAGAAPTHSYWTSDALKYSGSAASCSASVTTGTSCPVDRPMHVCAGATDPEGNTCTWLNCGLDSTVDNELGGCVTNPTAGALCCAD